MRIRLHLLLSVDYYRLVSAAFFELPSFAVALSLGIFQFGCGVYAAFIIALSLVVTSGCCAAMSRSSPRSRDRSYNRTAESIGCWTAFQSPARIAWPPPRS